jgi:hypothetical protein
LANRQYVYVSQAMSSLCEYMPNSWAQRLLVSLMEDCVLTTYCESYTIEGETSCKFEVENDEPVYTADCHWDQEGTLPDEFSVISVKHTRQIGDEEKCELTWRTVVYENSIQELASPAMMRHSSNWNWVQNSTEVRLGIESELWNGLDEFEHLEYGPCAGEVKRVLSGLCFESRNFQSFMSEARLGRKIEDKAKVGAPRIYDWERALAHVAAVANTDDGLFSADGTTITASRISEIMAEWFSSEGKAEPARSLLNAKAALVMGAMRTIAR